MSEYDVVWQFIFIRRAFIRKFLMKCFADIPDDGNDSICEVVRIERLQHQLNFLIPICFPERVENAFVSKNGQLPVPVRDIDQHAIAMFCLLHFQMKKDFLSAIHRVYVFAFTLYVDPDLATGTPLFFPDGINDGRLLCLSEKRLGLLERKKSQCYCFIYQSQPSASCPNLDLPRNNLSL